MQPPTGPVTGIRILELAGLEPAPHAASCWGLLGLRDDEVDALVSSGAVVQAREKGTP